MNRKRWLVLAMASVLALSGCSNTKGNQTDGPKATSIYETEDMSLDTVIMAVGDEEVDLQEMLFYLYQIKYLTLSY